MRTNLKLWIWALGAIGFASASQAAPRPMIDVPAMPSIVQNVQVSDPRVLQLEEELRNLRGRVEELNFIILELQDQLRRTQEDNEFRFQQLEGNGQQKGDAVMEPVPGQTETAAIPEEMPLDEHNQDNQTLGSIQFDAEGNALGGTVNEGAIKPVTGEADYDGAYAAFISGDFIEAERGFRSFIAAAPEGDLLPNANYWLGESLLAQQNYSEAAEVFLETNRQYPDSEKAQESLLKLGVAMSALNKKDIACAVFDQFGTRYPDADAKIKDNLAKERQRATCS